MKVLLAGISRAVGVIYHYLLGGSNILKGQFPDDYHIHMQPYQKIHEGALATS